MPGTFRGNPLLCADNFVASSEGQTPQDRIEPFVPGVRKTFGHGTITAWRETKIVNKGELF